MAPGVKTRLSLLWSLVDRGIFLIENLSRNTLVVGVTCYIPIFLEYLCPKSANVHGIEFTRFKVRDTVSQQVLFDIAKSSEDTVEEDDDVTSGRFIRYDFPPQLLNLSSLGAT